LALLCSCLLGPHILSGRELGWGFFWFCLGETFTFTLYSDREVFISTVTESFLEIYATLGYHINMIFQSKKNPRLFVIDTTFDERMDKDLLGLGVGRVFFIGNDSRINRRTIKNSEESDESFNISFNEGNEVLVLGRKSNSFTEGSYLIKIFPNRPKTFHTLVRIY
jgi:hypothetical protein